jgi:pimeloyl-ACP methyl ester carboxylesterase
VSALVTGGGDNLAWQYLQILADLVVQSSGEIALPYPIRDLNTGQYSSVLTFATLPESISVSAGWNGSRRARVLISGTGGSPEDSLPAAAVLRNDQIEMQTRSGSIVTTQAVGRLMDAKSPTEWFAANPIDPGVATLPGAGGLLGAAVMSDAAMSASAATVSSQLLGGAMRQVATVSMTAAGQLPRVAKYVKLRANNAATSPLTWVLREVRMRAAPNATPLAPGTARFRGDQRVSIRRLTLRQPIYQTTASGQTPTSSVTKLFIIPEEPNPWDPTPQPPLPPLPDPVPPPPPPPTTVPLPPSGVGDVPVVFQHGFQSNASAWAEMRSRLHPLLQIDDTAFSLPVTGNLYAASESLNVETRNRFGAQRVLAIAHSAGGLVSRRAVFNDPALISGLITVGTPHRGALLVERAEDAAAGFGALIPAIWVASPCVTGFFDPNGKMCSQFAIFGGGAVASIAGLRLADALGPGTAARQLDPSSTFVSDVNAPAESYVRIGITHRVPRRWSLATYFAEYINSPLPWNPGFGAEGTYDMSSTYRRALITLIQSSVMIWLLSEMEREQGRLQIDYSCGPAWTSPAAGCGYDPATPAPTRWAYTSSWYYYLLEQQAVASGTVLTFNVADWLWNKSVADGRVSDSFIAAESQQFPNNPGSAIPPVNIETDRSSGTGPLVGHSGETRSEMTRRPLVAVLQSRFGVPPRLF